jgi:outer membrane protein assembly factor BamB
MSNPTAAVPAKRRGFFRFWLPILILIGSAGWLGYVWLSRSEAFSFGDRVGTTISSTVLTFLLLAVWFLFMGPARWYMRALLIALVPCALVGLIRQVSFNGDMVPEFRFRWQPTSDDLLDAYNQSKQSGSSPAYVAIPRIVLADFPEYRGQKRDGVVHGPALSRDWKTHPPRQLWKRPVSGGYASVSVAGDLAVTIEQHRENEAVVAYDVGTGQEVWKFEYPGHFKEPLGGPGPRATPTIVDGEVYSLGANGDLVCLDLTKGAPRWTVNTLEDNENVQWGMSGSPLVYDNFVVVNPGAQKDSAKGRAVVAYDRLTGKVAWSAGSTKAGYSSPMLATLAGKRQVLLLDGDVLAGYDPQDGHELWHYDWAAFNGINVAQPLLLDGDRIFISTGYKKGCALLHVTNEEGKWRVESIWGNPNPALGCKFTSPVYCEGFFYGLDDGILACVEEKTGKRRWKDGRYGHGQLLLADDMLVIFSETGKLVLVQTNPDAFQELASTPIFAESKNWNPLSLANGKVFLRNEKELACYQLTP